MITIAICDAMKTDDTVALILVRVFNKKQLARKFVGTLLADDINLSIMSTHCQTSIVLIKSDSNVALLRLDTMATRTAKHYFKLIGYNYLRTVLGQHIERILADTSHYEIDPSRALFEQKFIYLTIADLVKTLLRMQ